MRAFLPVLLLSLLFACKGMSQSTDTANRLRVTVRVSLSKHSFKPDEDIRLDMTLLNETKQVQSVWFDKPRVSTGGPAWTLVTLTNKTTGEPVLKYESKTILDSQIYTTDQIEELSYRLKPGDSVKGQFSLYDMVVTKTGDNKLPKGTYDMVVFYDKNASNLLRFVVE